MTTESLLIELFVEELPPKALKNLGEVFARELFDQLNAFGLTTSGSGLKSFASPRRLAAHITNVLSKAPDHLKLQKLMPRSVAIDDDGKPKPALIKKAQSVSELCSELVARWPDSSTDKGKLFIQHDGKDEALFYETLLPGTDIQLGLQFALKDAIAKLPIPKVMTYQLHKNCEQPGWSSVNFVRPAHGLVALHGAEVVGIGALGLQAGRTTEGHRFEAATDTIIIRDADSYAEQLESEGAVIASFEKRRAEIARQLAAVAARERLQPVEDEALLDEVTALVERPNVLAGQFDASFLEVPQECLILTMKANQKYFPLLDRHGKLTNRFLMVSNIRPDDPSAVIGGNERVLRARLADAKFFYDQDRKTGLAARVHKLADVVYHNRLGSQLQRVQRIEKLAGAIAHMLGANVAHAERAAHLCKADLLTDMVGEFPELQGIMGRYYALHDGEPAAVAQAIREHYCPRFAGDVLPHDNVGASVALADKLDTLVGIYGIGLAPSGEKDPFGLRRHALGVLRILAEKSLPLDLLQLLHLAKAQFPSEVLSDSVVVDVHGFMLERLRNFLREGYAPDEVEAVLAQNPTRIDLIPPRLEAVQEFKKLPEAEALATANKRIQNILRKTALPDGQPDMALIAEPAEDALFRELNRLEPLISSLVQNEDYTDALCLLAGVRRQVDTFFDEVMVMTEEPLLRANRLALLNKLGGVMNQVADISKLVSEGR